MATVTRNQEIAAIIIEQLGGIGKLSAMVGANGFLAIDNGLQFTFKGWRKANKCIITLDGSDLYTMTMGRLNKKTYDFKEAYNQEGLYWSMLKPEFERTTGLYLSL